MTSPQAPTITFYDNYLPALPFGEYNISVQQVLTSSDPSNPVPALPTVTQKFLVRGARFQLTAADIHRQFPPPMATGLYHEFLPMIVFNKRAMPWERDLDNLATNTPLAGTPWFALLVFTGDQLQMPDGQAYTSNMAGSMTLSQYLAPTANTIFAPKLQLEDDENPDTITCAVIEMPTAVFFDVLPKLSELPFLAHCRQVAGAEANKEQSLVAHDGWFSVQMANRFAVPPPVADVSQLQQQNIAHLVSLEGFEPYLQDGDQSATLQNYTAVRMISLCSWTFQCVRDPRENFEQLMQSLVSNPGAQGENLLLRVPPPASPTQNAATQAVLQRLNEGYVALSYQWRSGAQNFTWYRGPCVPVPTTSFLAPSDAGQPDNALEPQIAAEAMRFDPNTGVFDQTYAVAFEVGRMNALASLPFATNLWDPLESTCRHASLSIL